MLRPYLSNSGVKAEIRGRQTVAENFDDARKWPEGLDDETRDSAAREDTTGRRRATRSRQT